MVLGPLELLVKVVREANPSGLAQFVNSRFRDADPMNVLSARLELLCAGNLAVMHVPFAFGGTGEPDLTWNQGTDSAAWVEIHRGAFSVFDDLQRALEDELAARDVTMMVDLDEWPLEVQDRNVLHGRISAAIDAAAFSGLEQYVSMPELGARASGVLRAGSTNSLGRITVHHGTLAPSAIYLSSLSRRLARKINVDKAGQARRGSWSNRTALMVDISTARLAQFLGQDDLASWLNGVPIEWEDIPFAGVAIAFSHLHGLVLSGVCRYRPGIDGADRDRLEATLSALGLAPS